MYRPYIDETGNADLGASHNPNHRYLSLTGIIIHRDHVRDVAHPRLEAIKAEFFGAHPDDPIVLHRKELIEKSYPFQALRDPACCARFDAALLGLLRDADYTVITAVIARTPMRRMLAINGLTNFSCLVVQPLR